MPEAIQKSAANLSIRIAFPAVLTALLFVGTIYLFFFPNIENDAMTRKKEMLSEVTETAWSVLSIYETQERGGLLTRAEAQARAMAQIRVLRYGPDRTDYFWITDMQHHMVMHPHRPDLEGQDMTRTDDADIYSNKLSEELDRVVREQGSGFVSYLWQWKDNFQKIVPKLSFVKEFQPWDWYIGTGIYTEDVLAEIAAIKQKILMITGGILVLVFLLTFYIIRQATLVEGMRKQADKALQDSEKRHKELANSLPQFIFETDEKGVLTFTNNYLADAIGLSRGDTDQGITAFLALAPEDRDRAMANMQRVMSGEKIGNIEYTALTKTGRTFPIMIHSERILHNGQPVGIRGVGIDIAEQKAAQAEKENFETRMRQAMKMETIGTLAGGIAHDFNNILSAILGYADLTRENLPKDDGNRYNIEQILRAGSRAKDLVKQILMFSRQSKQEKHPLQLELMLKEVRKFLRASLPATIEINLEITAKKNHVLADATQIHQVIMNLCTNAAHAMKNKVGKIHILLAEEVPDQTVLSNYPSAKEGTYLRLQVSDTGSGIPPDIMDRIFDPFFTTKKRGEGTGMGLSLVHGIVNDHDGFIEVESALDKGTTITIFLPKYEGDANLRVETAAPAKEGAERILFVDDEDMIVEIADRMFKKLGYDIPYSCVYHSIPAAEGTFGGH